MRVLVLTQYYLPEVGAPQIRLSSFARQLCRNGHRVTVVAAMPNYPAGRVFEGYRGRLTCREQIDGIDVIRTWIYAASGKNMWRRLANYLSFSASSLVGLVRAGRHDWVFVESPPLFLGLSGLLAARSQGAKFIFNVSDLWPESVKQLGMVRSRALLRLAERLEKYLYRVADEVTTVTEGMAAQIRLIEPAHKRVSVLPNGVDLELFRTVADWPDPSLARGKAYFTFAGTHGFAQSLGTLIEAAALVRDTPEIHFLFIGEGPAKASLQTQAASLSLANVTFVPGQPIARMGAYFSASRAAVVPLLDSPLFRTARPSKILPALACKTPVIFCGEGETARLLEQYACGMTVPPERPIELAKAVRLLASDEALAHRMGANGRDLAMARFSWEAIVGKWLEELE